MTKTPKRKVKTLAEYKNQFTLDGRLTASSKQPGVSERKTLFMKDLVEKALGGSREAKGRLEEVMTSTDAIFNWAHLMNIQTLPQYDLLQPTWQQIAGTRTVTDFRPAVLWSLINSKPTPGPELQGADPNPNDAPEGILPVVPEGANYPKVYFSGEESQSGGIRKRGISTDWTWEAFLNDSVGVIRDLPSNLTQLSVDTQDYDTYNTLITGVGADQKLVGGTIPDGTSVPVNSPLTRAALIRAIYELSQRKINNRFIKVTGGYNLLIPIGQEEYVRFWLSQTIAAVQDGSLTLTVSASNALANVNPIETEWITGTSWMLLPQPGATRRPVIDYAYLAGYTEPEIRIDNYQGNFYGGGAAGPFEGSFDNDSTTLRLRQVGGGILWTPSLVVTSTGAGS